MKNAAIFIGTFVFVMALTWYGGADLAQRTNGNALMVLFAAYLSYLAVVVAGD